MGNMQENQFDGGGGMIGYRISKLRTKQHLSLQQIADVTGIERSDLLMYENNDVQPSQDHLNRLASCLGVTEERLLGTDIDPSKFYIHVNSQTPLTDEEYDDIIDSYRDYKETLKNRKRWG